MEKRTGKILIVDDNALHLTLYVWVLQSAGHVCTSAVVRSHSLEMPADVDKDTNLILLDYRLNSSLSALDVLKELRKTFPVCPVIVLSELQWMPDDMRGHAVSFVNKGDPQGLLKVVESLLANGPSSV